MNIDKLIEANKEIAALKEQAKGLIFRDAMLSTAMTKLQVAHNDLVEENAVLKARVWLFRNELKMWVTMVEHGNTDHFEINEANAEDTRKLLDKTPQQCLSQIKAAAIKEYVDSFDGNSETKVYLSCVKKTARHTQTNYARISR